MNGGFRVAAPDEVIAAAAQRAADTASAVDQHDAPTLAETLAGYGSLGALGLGVERDGHDVTDAVALLSAVAAECMSTAFSLWAHRMVTEYVRASSLPDRDELLGELVTGRLAGSIAMATALQESAGLGTVPTVAETDGVGGYRVSGRIAWASNIARSVIFSPVPIYWIGRSMSWAIAKAIPPLAVPSSLVTATSVTSTACINDLA